MRILKISCLSIGTLLLGYGLVSAAEGEAPAAEPAAGPIAEAHATLHKMEATADNVDRQLRQANDDADAVKILCLDDKLNQVNVATRSAGDRVESIEAAVNSGNMERAEHDAEVLGALAERTEELGTEANECIGEEAGVMTGSTLTLKVDEDIPIGDTTTPPRTPPLGGGTPPIPVPPIPEPMSPTS